MAVSMKTKTFQRKACEASVPALISSSVGFRLDGTLAQGGHGLFNAATKYLL